MSRSIPCRGNCPHVYTVSQDRRNDTIGEEVGDDTEEAAEGVEIET